MAVTPDVDYVPMEAVVGAMIGDGTGDPDKNPDFVPATEGTILITPNVKVVHVTDSTTGKVVALVPFPIECTIDAQGRLTYRADNEVTLVDLGSDKVNPSIPRDKAAYTVSFKNVMMDGANVALDPFGINPSLDDIVAPATLVNLWDLQPLAPGGGGAGIVRGQGVPSVTSAEAGQVITYDGTEIKWADPTGGGGGAELTSYETQVESLSDYPTTFPPSTHDHTVAQISDATTTGRNLMQAANVAGARAQLQVGNVDNTADLDKPISTATQTALDGKVDDADIPTADTLSGATATGKAVMKATDAAAARTAIGAGTSNLALGTTGSTALAGNTAFVPPTRTVAGKALSANVTLNAGDVGLDQVDNTADADKAFDASQIGSGTFSTSRLPAGTTLTVTYNAGWPTRPTARTDITVQWIGGTEATPPTAGVTGVDLWIKDAEV